MKHGLVTRSQGGFFAVYSEGTTRLCRARGIFKKQGIKIMVGDRVLFEPIGLKEGIIRDVLPRDSVLVRPPIANIHQVLIIFSIITPPLNRILLDKMLVAAHCANLASAIVLTKCDLASKEEIEAVCRVYEQVGYKVVPVAVKQGLGVEYVLPLLEGNSTVFAGPSGVGKSTLANAIHPELGLRMGEVSEKAGLGRHTTRHLELFHLAEDTWVADAPGFSQLDIHIPSIELKHHFPEFNTVVSCPYRGCTHIREDDCAIKHAVSCMEIDSDRYESYRMIYESIRDREEHQF